MRRACTTSWRARLLAATTLWLCSAAAHAGLTIHASRVIYPESAGEAAVSFTSHNDAPVLVQAWLDAGDAHADPQALDLPFLLMPAVARVEARQGQTIRILATRGDFAPDRETLYWFNLLEVPFLPQGQAAQDNTLQIAGRARLKFFYRPLGLAMAPERVYEALRFARAPNSADGRMQIRIHNPTPYHVSFNDLTLRARDGNDDHPPLAHFQPTSVEAHMLSPFSDALMPLDRPPPAAARALEVVFDLIGDQGGIITGRAALDVVP